MAISGVQLIYRLRETVRLLINHRVGVDSFNFYWSATSGGVYALISNVSNTPSTEPAIRGKIRFEFNVGVNGLNWNNDSNNYIKLAPVTGGVEGALEGPNLITPRYDYTSREPSTMYGYNEVEDRFIPVAVDETGKLRTTNI